MSGMLEGLGFLAMPVCSATSLDGVAELHLLELPRSEMRLDAAASLLCAAERGRAERIVVVAARRRFVATRAALRVLVGERLEIDPLAVSFSYGVKGKPCLDLAGGLTFNVSHSGDMALVALAEGAEVGVDIQQIEPRRDWAALLQAVCEPDEYPHLLSESHRRGAVVFFERWVAHEALLKAAGTGFSGAEHPDPTSYRVSPLKAPNGYAAAVAVERLQAPRRRTRQVVPSASGATRKFQPVVFFA